MQLVNTKQAAEELGISVRRVRMLIHEEKISAVKLGRDWVIDYLSLGKVKIYGKRGRPKKILDQSRQEK